MKHSFSMINKIPTDVKDSFVKSYQYENYQRLSLFSFILLLEEITRLLLNRCYVTIEHLCLNYLMIGFISLIIPLAFFIKNKYKDNMQAIHSWLLNTIIFIIMLWCVAMTLVEVREINNMNTITIGFFAIAALTYIHPRISLALYSTTTLIFCLLLPQFADSGLVKEHILDAIFIAVIAFALSHIIFKLKLEVFIDQKIIEDSNKKLYNQSIRDSMTSLYNHNHSLELLSEAIDSIKHGKTPPSLLFIDIDLFKQINDKFGHSVGDYALLDVANIIESTIRSTDYAGRYGGEEFIVIFPETPLQTAYEIAEQIRKNIETTLKTQDYSITISGGIIQCNDESVDANIIEADRLLYQAKDLGRNRIIK